MIDDRKWNGSLELRGCHVYSAISECGTWIPLSIRPIYSCNNHSTFVHPYNHEINTTSTSIGNIAIIKYTSIQKHFTFITMVIRTVSLKQQRRDLSRM
jgi:hypothetical protein